MRPDDVVRLRHMLDAARGGVLVAPCDPGSIGAYLANVMDLRLDGIEGPFANSTVHFALAVGDRAAIGVSLVF
jgi:hypothetical protein